MGLALTRHFLTTLQLNFRSKQAIVYGYLVPLFFLVAFASVFRNDTPLLYHQVGQLLTISLLGGACFGLPTALVAERERGVWRRYRLLPIATGWLVVSTLLSRIVIIASAAALQLGLAHLLYHTPFPLHPAEAFCSFIVVTVSFLGLGLLVAALATDVPSVQALGQCLFLPMILIGGVGVPLAVLPSWAQKMSGFMPGRYAVDVLQRSFSEPRGLREAGFSLGALAVIGLAAGLAGAKLFRWESARGAAAHSSWSGLWSALLAWLAVGFAAASTGRLDLGTEGATAYSQIRDEQVAALTYEDLPGDDEIVTRLARPFTTTPPTGRLADFAIALRTWPPGHLEDVGQSVRNLVAVATIADLGADLLEGEIARTVFNEMKASFRRDDLRRALAWIILAPDGDTVITAAPELTLPRRVREKVLRERSPWYARKFLGRIEGKLPE